MKNLSVVVITRNRLAKLRRCLESIEAVLPQAEIIVVDNGSMDGTVAYLKSASRIIPVTLPYNHGVAGARNVGIKKVSTEFVMFLDDDAWLDHFDWHKVRVHLDVHPRIGVIAPRLLYPNGTVQESVRSFPTVAALIWRGLRLYKLFPNVSWYLNYIRRESTEITEVDWAIGACQIIRRSLFESDHVGLLDENYFFGYEDADFCRRAKKCGYSSVFWPDATIFHEYARTSARGINISLLRHLKSICRYFYKAHTI